MIALHPDTSWIMAGPEETAPKSNEGLREEFNRLRREQDAFMKRAVYLGMTIQEAKEYEKLRGRLTELFEKLYQLKSSP